MAIVEESITPIWDFPNLIWKISNLNLEIGDLQITDERPQYGHLFPLFLPWLAVKFPFLKKNFDFYKERLFPNDGIHFTFEIEIQANVEFRQPPVAESTR